MIFSLERLGCDRLVALNFQFLVKRKISRSRSIVGGFVRHGKAARSRILVTDMWKTAKSMSLPVPTRVIRRVQPVISLRSRRKAGIVYRIPYLLDRFRRFSFALRWFRFSVRERSERTYKSRLVEEFMSLANRQGSTWQRRRSLYKTALLNRGFLRLLRHLF